jgi:opacity protein-like surface antigen
LGGGPQRPIIETYSNGYGVSGALGYASRLGFRPEVEFTYYRADISGLRQAVSSFQGGSDRHYMANLLYDIPLPGTFSRWKPYVGAGVGATSERWELNVTTPDGVNTASTTERSFAYQATAGLAYRVTDALDLLVGYRYVRTEERALTSPTTGQPFPHDAAVIHFLEVGLRYHFD